uniref:Tail fiber assembly protein n=1 Tax=Arsenophonus endosymbiont of Trialeurodes vaporariorum TaxID=235567 RepID=A0A3B0MF92_9GAMM
MQLNNFKRYEPENPPDEIKVQYFISEDGTDFYESFNSFTMKYKIGFDENDFVRTMSDDISAIYPDRLSIVDIETLPNDFDINEKWVYKNGKITRYKLTKNELIQQAEQNKFLLMDSANIVINPLQEAVDLDIANEDKKIKLTEWRKYRVLLNRVDVSTALDIEWPQKPV